MTEIKVSDYIPNVIRVSDLKEISLDIRLFKEVRDIMTPDEIFDITEFEKPEVITPYLYPDFDSLLLERNRIRRLQLVPIKSEEEYQWYHKQPPELLASLVLDCLGDSPLALAPERFPNFLPEDVGQYMVWARDMETTKNDAAEFTTKCMQLLGLDTTRVILFERPLNIQTRLVRGSFPAIRHIHFWRKLASN